MSEPVADGWISEDRGDQLRQPEAGGQLLCIGSLFGLFLLITWKRLALNQKQVNL